MSRVVVFSPNWLGDAVMALPALADIRRHHAGASLTVAAREKLLQLFACVPGVDEVLPLGEHGGLTGFRERTRDARRLAAGRFDAAILLPNSLHTAWLAWRARVPERMGYGRDGRGLLLTKAVRRPPRGTLHQAQYYQNLTAALGIPTGPLAASIVPPAGSGERAASLLELYGAHGDAPMIGVAPGAAYGHAKRWPPERFAEAIVSFAASGWTTVLVGSAGDREAGIEIEQALAARGASSGIGPGHGLANVIGRTDLHTLLGVMAACRAFVSNDSGAMHLAAAVGTPLVAIFGASDERETAPLPWAGTDRTALSGPAAGAAPSPLAAPGREPRILTHAVRCRPCLLRECPIDHRCMRRIEAAQVVEAVRELIGTR